MATDIVIAPKSEELNVFVQVISAFNRANHAVSYVTLNM